MLRVRDLSCMLIPCPALLQLIMQTATAGGRPSSRPANSGSGGGAGEGRKAAAAAAAAGDACETLEHLSATALLQLLRLADATEQLGALFSKLPVDNGAAGTSAQQGQADGSSSAGDGAAGVAAAVMPRLPQLLACTDSLLQQGCFKEAQVATPLCAAFQVPSACWLVFLSFGVMMHATYINCRLCTSHPVFTAATVTACCRSWWSVWLCSASALLRPCQ